jgi:hypothetical protein
MAGAAPPANIVAVVTAGIVDGKRQMVLRVAGEAAEGYPERLAKQLEGDVEVLDVH